MGLKSKLFFPPQKKEMFVKKIWPHLAVLRIHFRCCDQGSKYFLESFWVTPGGAQGVFLLCAQEILLLVLKGRVVVVRIGDAGDQIQIGCLHGRWLTFCTIAPAPKGSLLVVLGSHSPCMVWNWHGSPARYNAFWYRTTSKGSHTWYFWIQCRLESDV